MFVSKLYPELKLKHNHLVAGIKSKSFKCVPGDIFVAIPGATVDGFTYARQAIACGAKTIVTEHREACEELKDFGGNIIIVEDAKRELARLAKCVYQKDLEGIKVIGITGTNGKTTVSTLVYRYLRSKNQGVILIGTNGNYVNDDYFETTNTTPNILEIYSLIRASKGSVSYLVMEVSSQAVREMRVLGLEFNIVLLTNLSQDHLDYHKTFDDYKWSKGLLVSRVQDKKDNFVILNHDIPYFSFYHQLTLAKTVTFGLNQADYQARINAESIDGSDLTVTVNDVEYRFFLHMLGRFNVYNALSFLAIIDCLHLFEPDVITFLSQDLKIDGRMEMYDIRERQVIIDFAHTPEGIREVLTFLNMIKRKRIISIIGCGGDRDRSKRPLMGQITSELSDLVYFTEDNSRNEDPHNIISDIIAGVLRDNYVVEIDRKKAIRKAFEDSKEGDIIAILGKGHENYLITNNLKTHYSDKEEVLALKEEFK